MENSIYIALSRQTAVRRELDVIANNVANANTDSYKRERVVFREYLSAPMFRERYSFTDDVGTSRDMTVGTLKSTSNTFDLALNSDGFFVVNTPMGERYTRHGRFQLDADSNLVNSEGYAVMGDTGPIEIPENAGRITITGDGVISSEFFGELDRVRVVRFEDQKELRRAGGSLYVADIDMQPEAHDQPKVLQGALEGSNIQPIREITRMMDVSRGYEAITQFVNREDERIKKMVDKVGTPFGG